MAIDRVVGMLTESQLDRSVGEKITDMTIESLQKKEENHPGTVSSIFAIFRLRTEHDPDGIVASLNRGQGNRETRHGVAVQNSSIVQRPTHEWLQTTQATECFRACPNFDFQYERDVHRFSSTNTLILPGTSELVSRLRKQDQVIAVGEDFRIHQVPDWNESLMDHLQLLGKPSKAGIHIDGYTWGWDRLGLNSIHASNTKGTGIRFGIINSGVCERHPDLKYKIKDFAKVQVPAVIQPCHAFDNNAHGTHCAGTIVGHNNSEVQIGGAPEAELTAVSVIDGSHGWASSLVTALDWLADPYRSVSVINLSVGVKSLSPEMKIMLDEVILRVSISLNIVCVAAVGNDGQQACLPASLTNVLSAGAFAPDGTVWAQSAKDPDLVLPGVSIYSALPPAHPDFAGQCYGWFTGTSSAAAHLSALVGLLMQHCPTAGPRLITEALLNTASCADLGDGETGRGEPDFWEAVRYVDGFKME